jgi:hypothetical protein
VVWKYDQLQLHISLLCIPISVWCSSCVHVLCFLLF